eukprot:TRINITY_DN8529_c0_g1_i1.p1 TRINITY_DN8529_c0_g1~~TRINITY_DN8529_c0_g1_i1.p1  ORF type:complete len:497 (-),score=141.01 TRINITY_DN8529_c0_g1_i1:245-1735(-)
MRPGASYQCHSSDISNILSRFSEKYLHLLDRSSLDTLLQDGSRLVGDLTDLELEYFGFSFVHQLSWASFSSHNTYLRSSASLKNQVLENKDGLNSKKDSPKKKSPHASSGSSPQKRPLESPQKKYKLLSTSPPHRKTKSVLKSPHKNTFDGSPKNISQSPHSKPPLLSQSPVKMSNRDLKSSGGAQKAPKTPHSFVSSILNLPMPSNDNTTCLFNEEESSTPKSHSHPQSFKERKDQNHSSNPPRSHSNPSSFLTRGKGSSPSKNSEVVLFPSSILKKKSDSRHVMKSSSIMDLPLDILAPETPELLSSPPSDPHVSIPDTADFLFEDEESKDRRTSEAMRQSPILSNYEDDMAGSSPSILSNRRLKENNKWGFPPPPKDQAALAKKQSYKQGTLEGFLNESSSSSSSAVKTKSGRALLEGFDCMECKTYYKDANLSEEEIQSLLKSCSRHRAKIPPPSLESQNERWELEIREDEDERNKTQMGPPLKVRKRRNMR